MISAFAS